MTESSHSALVRVNSGDREYHHIFYSQRRHPYWRSSGNGYRYGPTTGSFGGHTLIVEQWETGHGLTIMHHGVRSAGSSDLSLGNEKNQVDVCMWGLPDDAFIESDLFDIDDLQIAEGEIQHRSEGTFDRRIIVPIHAGTLSVHLAVKEWEPRAS